MRRVEGTLLAERVARAHREAVRVRALRAAHARRRVLLAVRRAELLAVRAERAGADAGR